VSKKDQSPGHQNQIVTDLERKKSLLKAISDFATELLNIPTRTELVWYVARKVVGQLGFDDCVIYLIDPEQGKLHQVAAIGVRNPHGNQIVNALEIPIGESITGQVARSKLPIIVDDLSADDRYIPDVEPALSEICVPLIIDEEVVGVIDCEDPRPRHFGQEDLKTLTTIAAVTCAKLKIIDEAGRVEERAEELRRLNEQLQKEIVERKEAEEELRESEERYRSILNSMADTYYRADAEGRIVMASRSATDLLGYSIEELIGRKLADMYVDADGREKFLQSLKEGGGSIKDYQASLRRKYGTEVWVSTNARFLLDTEGRVTGVEGTMRDVTDRKRAEESLQESERRLQTIAKMAKLGYFIWDLVEDRCVYCSEEYARIHGMSVDEYMASVTTLESDSQWVHPKDRARFNAAAKASMVGLDYFELEYRILGKDGQVRYVHEKESFFEVKDGVAVMTEGTLQDITETKQTEERLRQAEKMEAVGHLTNVVANQFNNLLASILTSAELLEDELEDDGTRRRLVAAITRSALKGGHLTQQLSAYSRQRPLYPKATDLDEQIAAMETILRPSLGETIELKVVPSEGLWTTEIDPEELQNAVLNLAINARDAMPDGGRLTIETENVHLDETQLADLPDHEPGDYVTLAVRDTGVGMSPEVVERAFDPFFTTKAGSQRTGLGLSMVQGFVAQSGGFVRLETDDGQGTVVRLYFPRGTEEATEGEPEAVREPTLE
jgi:PAS domain S-box-containing protein